MIREMTRGADRSRSAFAILSMAGAALAGAGAGALLWFNFGPIGWSIVVVGCVSFLLGKLGARRR